MIRTLGVPTFFLTFSYDDLNSQDAINALLAAKYGPHFPRRKAEDIPYPERKELLNDYPVAAARHFSMRIVKVINLLKRNSKAIFGKEMVDYSVRVEFQGRGSPHCHCLLWLKDAARNKAELVIFPECALSGYCFSDRGEAWAVAEELSGPSCSQLAAAARELGCFAVVGLLEREGQNLYNSAVIIGPRGVMGVHRKIHLLHLGVDRFTTLGDIPFPLFQARDCRFGVNICFDCSFPESGRVLKLKGAQLLAIPTNWPITSDSWEHTPKVRATENHIFVAAADRVGEERGFTFAGHSQIIDCEGKVLAEAGATEETILLADIDPAAADKNRVIQVPGQYEYDRIASRRPEMYEALMRQK